MDKASGKKELSIIVPVFNEAKIIPAFFENLASQRGVDFEVIVCDGGSDDETCFIAEQVAKSLCFPVRIISGGRGRGRQMNRGAEEAAGDYLLFLHVDSLFDDEYALRTGIDALMSVIASMGRDSVAGRFALRFRQRSHRFAMLYYYHECKAMLNRSECIHGDQGFMLPRSFYFSAGPFDETIPVLEDTHFAESVRDNGIWTLFPCLISTSARRFETEGPVRREILNSMVMALGAMGRYDFLLEIPNVYASLDRSGRLKLYPFFCRIRSLLSKLLLRERISFWYSCGTYVASNSWQPAFLIDVRRNFRCGSQPGEGRNTCLDRFDRYAGVFIRLMPVKVAACVLVWTYFHISLICFFVGEKAFKKI